MHRRRTAALCAAILASVIAVQGVQPEPAADPLRDAHAASSQGNGAVGTVLIFVDDLRAEMGPYGTGAVVHTPGFDRLASAWTRTFRHAHTPIAICSPSRWATLSGLRPDRTRLWYIGPNLRDTFDEGANATTLPQAFKEAGKWVKGAGKVFHPGTSSGGPSPSMGGADSPRSYTYENQTTTHGYFW